MTVNGVPSLPDVQEAFRVWRRERPTRQTPIELRAQAVALLQRYSVTEVMKALGLDHRRLSRWRRELSGSAEPIREARFVELPAVESLSAATAERAVEPAAVPPMRLTLSRQHADGARVSVSGTLEAAQWRWALALLSEGGA